MPTTQFVDSDKYSYLYGFGSYHKSEVITEALPVGANSPHKCPLGLYAEELSGTAFTALRHENLQSWLYRILPSAARHGFTPYTVGDVQSCPGSESPHYLPDQLRWDPFEVAGHEDWVGGIRHVAGAGHSSNKSGVGIMVYAAAKDVPEKTATYSADGDFLIVPQEGSLDVQTEFGNLLVRPHEIAVIPRGIRYRVILTSPGRRVRGFVLGQVSLNRV